MRHTPLVRTLLAISLLLPAAALHAKQLGAERAPSNIEARRMERLAQLVRLSVPPPSLRHADEAWDRQGMLVNEEFLAVGVENPEARVKGIAALREKAIEIVDAETELAKLVEQGDGGDSSAVANRNQRIYVLKVQISQALQATKARIDAIGAEYSVDMIAPKPGVSTWPQTGGKGP